MINEIITLPGVGPDVYNVEMQILRGIAPPPSFNDWFLPSKDELIAMHDELYSYEVGEFEFTRYWSSSEETATTAWFVDMDYDVNDGDKTILCNVRACRKFTTTDTYALRDTGPAGGLIFIIVDNGGGSFTYYEAAPSDQSTSCIWSDISNIASGATNPNIGGGEGNTGTIVNQTENIIDGGVWYGSNFDVFVPDGNNIESLISYGETNAVIRFTVNPFLPGPGMKLEFSIILNDGVLPYIRIQDDEGTEMDYRQVLAAANTIEIPDTIGLVPDNIEIYMFNRDAANDGDPQPTDIALNGFICNIISANSAAKLCNDLIITP